MVLMRFTAATATTTIKKETNHKWAVCASNGNAVIFSHNNLSLWFRCHTEFRNFTWITPERVHHFLNRILLMCLCCLVLLRLDCFTFSFCVCVCVSFPSFACSFVCFVVAGKEMHSGWKESERARSRKLNGRTNRYFFFPFSYVYVLCSTWARILPTI